MFKGAGDLKLKELANLLLIKETIGNMDVEITGLEMDSRKITDGDLFICVSGIDGFLEDRHQFVEEWCCSVNCRKGCKY